MRAKSAPGRPCAHATHDINVSQSGTLRGGAAHSDQSVFELRLGPNVPCSLKKYFACDMKIPSDAEFAMPFGGLGPVAHAVTQIDAATIPSLRFRAML